MNNTVISGLWPVLLTALLLTMYPAVAGAALSLEQAVAMAQKRDPWILGSEHQQRALEAQSIAAGSLPDPVITTGFANLPTDTFEFNQEAMTQFKVGLSQALPRGNSRDLQREKLQLLGQQHPHHRAGRLAQVESEVSRLWLDAWRARETIRLIETDKNLFEQLVDIVESKYTTALGGTRQQDLIRAQLELTRLEDRLIVLQEQMDAAQSALGEWLLESDQNQHSIEIWPLAEGPPSIRLLRPDLVSGTEDVSLHHLANLLGNHPIIRAQDKKLEASETGVKLAEQQYRPQWRLNASYGYRDDDPMGNSRADFFSVGVAFDLPIFTNKRQDQQLQSAKATSESFRTDRALTLRRLIAEFNAHRSRLQRLEQREKLYGTRLLEQMSEQAEASLSAYTNDDADFAEVVRAKIAELNARIEVLDITVERQKTIAQLNYFFVNLREEEGI